MPGSLQGGNLGLAAMRDRLHKMVTQEGPWDPQKTVKNRKNTIASICGLEPIYMPNLALESLCTDRDGKIISVVTGRDGRFLWSGKTKLTKYPNAARRKFTYFRSLLPGGIVKRLDQISSLLTDISVFGLRKKTVSPLTRLSLFWLKMCNKDFKGLLQKIRSSLSTKQGVRRPTAKLDFSRFIPYLVEGMVVKSKSPDLAYAPVWEYRPRMRFYGSAQAPYSGENPR